MLSHYLLQCHLIDQVLSIHGGSPLQDPITYRSIVGALQYCTLMRPDISFAVNKACQFMHSPIETHRQAVKRILWYLRGMMTHGISLQGSSDLPLTTWVCS